MGCLVIRKTLKTLFRPDATSLDGLLEALFVVVGDGDILLAEDNATSLDHLDLLGLHDKGAMHTDKTIRWQHILQVLHAHQGEDRLGLSLHIDLHIVLQPLDVEDVA